jgi:twitching motility protein PilT
MTSTVPSSALGRLGIDEFLAEGRSRSASDAHLEADCEGALRIDGLNVPREYTFSQKNIDAFVDDAFASAPALRDELMSIRGKASIGFAGHGYGRIRVHAYRVDGSTNLAIRYVDETLEQLEADRFLPKTLRDIALRDRGLVFVAGRNGSGKTRLLNRMLDYRRRQSPGERGLTLENPKEYAFENQARLGSIVQREFGRDFGDWADAIDGSLEENPDYLVVAQSMGSSAMAATTTIANTGLPTSTTIHTIDTTRVYQRALDETPSTKVAEVRANLLESTHSIIGIRLIPTLGGEPGKRRTAIIEILSVNDDVRNLFRSGDNISHSLLDIMESRNSSGMQTFEQHIAQLYGAQVISREVAEKAALRKDRLRLPPTPQGASR